MIAWPERTRAAGRRHMQVDLPRAYREVFADLHQDAGVHPARVFGQKQAGDDALLLRNIRFSSMGEHHLLPFTGRAHVAGLPSGGQGRGLSTPARTVDVFAPRPQMQERLTAQVADALVEHLNPRG